VAEYLIAAAVTAGSGIFGRGGGGGGPPAYMTPIPIAMTNSPVRATTTARVRELTR
jgi:hypothetical protein